MAIVTTFIEQIAIDSFSNSFFLLGAGGLNVSCIRPASHFLPPLPHLPPQTINPMFMKEAGNKGTINLQSFLPAKLNKYTHKNTNCRHNNLRITILYSIIHSQYPCAEREDY